MDPLVSQMVHDDPEKRPTMDEVVASFKEISSKLSACQLRARLVKHNDGLVLNVLKGVHHTTLKTLPRVLSRRSPLPTPKS